MNRLQLLVLGFPTFLFCSDLVSLFSSPSATLPSKAPLPRYRQPQSQSVHEVPDFASVRQGTQVGGSGYGTLIELKFCVSCSYRGTAVNMKNILEASFPGIEVVLSNYPPAFLKQIAAKAVPVAQVGIIGVIMAGEQIFSRLGMVPPPWYYSLRANKFGAIASTWLVGNFLQSTLQSSGAFEVYCNNELVFSKLKEQRFPGEIELRQLIGQRLPAAAPAFGKNLDAVWS